MRSIRIIYLFLTLCLLIIPLAGGEQAIMKDNPSLILASDKKIYSTGERIKFTYTFLNRSDQPIYILPWGGEYSINWITVYSDEGEKLSGLPSVYYEKKFIPLKDDFILLEPKGSYSIEIEGKIVMAEFSKFNREDQKKYKGLFIDFGNSVIYLGKSGNFTIKAIYEGKDEWADKGKSLYNLSNIFAGELTSEELKIQIN